MPDKWEYPFFAAWDTAFHCIPLAMVDPAFAKQQLKLLVREWYMKPDGQIPAYEWNFSDVNPPVHAWATFRVFKIERKLFGKEDVQFLESVFQKLLLNFTWLVAKVCLKSCWSDCRDAGGLIVKTPVVITYSRADFWVSITLELSIGLSLSLQVVFFDRQMEPPGWPSIASTCALGLIYDLSLTNSF